MIDFKKSFRVEGLSLADRVGIFGGNENPNQAAPATIPIGSLYLRDNGRTFKKVANPNTWVEVAFVWRESLEDESGNVCAFPVAHDPSRNGKILTLTEHFFIYSESGAVSRGTWLPINTRSASTQGYVAPFDGTIIGITAQARNIVHSPFSLDLFFNNSRQGELFRWENTAPHAKHQNFSLNIDFSAGQRLRLRVGQGSAQNASASDPTCILYTRWRLT